MTNTIDKNTWQSLGRLATIATNEYSVTTLFRHFFLLNFKCGDEFAAERNVHSTDENQRYLAD